MTTWYDAHCLAGHYRSLIFEQMFFAVHLFKEQIFSMSDHLERILKQFLKVLRNECCLPEHKKKYKSDEHREEFGDWGDECMGRYLCITNGQCIKPIAEMMNTNKEKKEVQQLRKLMVDAYGDVKTLDAAHQAKIGHYCSFLNLLFTHQKWHQLDGTEVNMDEFDPQKWHKDCSKTDLTPFRAIMKMIEDEEKMKNKHEALDNQWKIHKLHQEAEKQKDIKDIETKIEDMKRKTYMKCRVMEILMKKFNDFRKNPNPQQRVRFDRISPQLLRFFTHDQDVEETVKNDEGKLVPKPIARTISFKQIMMVYPNIKTITFVDRHLDSGGHNTSCLNELVIRSLLHEVSREREEEEPNECPLKKVVFTYYDYAEDIFKANEKLWTGNKWKETGYFDEDIVNNEGNKYRKDLDDAGWRFKNHKIGSGYKIRIER